MGLRWWSLGCAAGLGAVTLLPRCRFVVVAPAGQRAEGMWFQGLLEVLATGYTLAALALLAGAGRRRCLRRWAVGAVCGSVGELLIAESGVLVWEYPGWRSYFVFPPTALALMWGLWSALLCELPRPRDLVLGAAADATQATLLAASVEPVAVRQGWWSYSRFAYRDWAWRGLPVVEGPEGERIPCSVFVAYWVAFACLNGCGQYWERAALEKVDAAEDRGATLVWASRTLSTALPLGVLGFWAYVACAARLGDAAALAVLLAAVLALRRVRSARCAGGRDALPRGLALGLLGSVHGFCAFIAAGCNELNLTFQVCAAALLQAGAVAAADRAAP